MKSSRSVRLTDAATELADLVEHMSLQSYGDHVSLLSGICTYGGLVAGNYATMEAVGELNKRFYLLREFVATVDDDMLDNATRVSLCGSVDALHSLADPSNFHTSWNSLLKKERVNPHIIALRLLARTVRHHEPMKRVEPDEIDRLRESIAESIREVQTSDELDGWEKALLLKGLSQATFIIDHLNFFGQDAFLSHLIEIRFGAEVVANAGRQTGRPTINLVAFSAFLLLASEVMIRPAEVMQALDTYKSAYSALFLAAPPQIAPPLKQIEGPKGTTAGEEHDKA